MFTHKYQVGYDKYFTILTIHTSLTQNVIYFTIYNNTHKPYTERNLFVMYILLCVFQCLPDYLDGLLVMTRDGALNKQYEVSKTLLFLKIVVIE
jgi:hypothetical protein